MLLENRLAHRRVATNLQFVKNAVSGEPSTMKQGIHVHTRAHTHTHTGLLVSFLHKRWHTIYSSATCIFHFKIDFKNHATSIFLDCLLKFLVEICLTYGIVKLRHTAC